MARNIGQNDIIELPSAAFLLGQSTASIMLWFRVSDNASFRHFYVELANFNEEIYFRLTNNGFADFFWRTPTAIASGTGSTAFDDGNWHRALLVRRANNDFEIYVDEVSQATSTANPGTATPTMTVYVGNHPIDDAQGLRGDIARFISLTRAVTPDEAKGILFGDHPGLSRRVWLEMGYGSPEPDFSGNGYDGTLTGTTVADHAPMGYPFWFPTQRYTYSPPAVLLAGSSSLVFSAASSLLVEKVLGGASSLTFTATASLLVEKLLSGASSIVFAPAADIEVQKLLGGSSSLVFTVVGALLDNDVFLAGSSALTLGASAALRVEKPLAASSGIVFSQSGDLRVQKNLAGSTQLVFTAIGSLVPVFPVPRYVFTALARQGDFSARQRNTDFVASAPDDFEAE